MDSPKRIIRRSRGALAAAFFFSGGINLLMLAVPIYTLQMFTRVIPSGSMETLVYLTGIVLAALITLALLEIVRDRILLRLGLWLDHALGKALLEGAAHTNHDGERTAESARSLALVRGALVGSAINPLFDAPWIPLFLVVLFLLHPIMGFVALVTATLLGLVAVLQGLTGDELHDQQGKWQSQAEAWWRRLASDAGSIAAAGLSGSALERWQASNVLGLEASYRLGVRSSWLRGFARFVRMAAQVAVFGVGAFLIVRGEMVPGALIAASILMGRALAPIEQSLSAFRLARLAWNALQQLSRQGGESMGDRARPCDEDTAPEGRLQLREVTVYRPGRSRPALRAVDFALEPSVCLGIIGPNGSGKSTLIDVIAGRIPPHAGTAELDGVATALWQARSARVPIGYCGEMPGLIEGTVHENITRFRGHSLHAATRAAKRIGVHDILSDLPQGYETRIDPAHPALSMVEQRAIALARAMHDNPVVLVLDEPEIGLDRLREQRLHAALDTLKREGTTIVIASHQVRFLSLTDRLLVLNGGAVDMFGPSEEVMDRLFGRAEREAVRLQPAPLEAVG